MTDCLDAGLICIVDNRCVTRPRMCGEKDFVGNSKGVGTYCRYDGDCPATAPHCALDVDVRLADLRFCTAACGSADGVVDASCGESAACDPDFKLCILDTCRALVCATTDHDCDH